MTSQLFVGIDVGSASVRSGIFAAKGQRPAFAVRVVKRVHPRPLYVEQCSTDMVRPGESVAARQQTKAFHDARYAVDLPLYQDMEPFRSAMLAWQ